MPVYYLPFFTDMTRDYISEREPVSSTSEAAADVPVASEQESEAVQT